MSSAEETRTATTTTTVMSGGSIPNIEPKLDGMNNYNSWKFMAKMVLMGMDLWDCVDTSSQTQVDSKRDQRALATICLNIKTHCHVHVTNAKSAREAWSNLSKIYEDNGLSRRLSLLNVLFAIKLENFNSLEEYVTEIMSVSQKLADISHPIEDEFIGVLMLRGLPSSFKPLVMGLQSSNQKITSDLVKNMLLQEDIKQGTAESSSADAAFAAKTSNYNKKPRKVVRCYGCGLLGHKKPNCPNKPRDSSNSSSQEQYSGKKEKNSTLLAALSAKINNKEWYIDSGATSHMTGEKEWFINFSEEEIGREVTIANDEKLYTAGTGDVVVNINGSSTTIEKVTYVPNLGTNLLSVNSMVQKGLGVKFNQKGSVIYEEETEDIVATATNVQGLYKLNTQEEKVNIAVVKLSSHELWHRRLCHLNARSMALLKNGMVSGVNFKSTEMEPCVPCIMGKQSKKPFKNSTRRADEKLEIVHADLCGPMSEASFVGARYMFVLIDDCTRRTFAYFLKSKDEVSTAFQEFKAQMENETGLTIKTLRTDNGGEFVNNTMRTFLKKHGIKHELTVPYTPEQNGVAERANRTIIEKVRCMLNDASLSLNYWAEAANTAVYIKNRTPTRAVRNKTPEEAWTNKPVNLCHLKIFGSRAFVHVNKSKRNKLDVKSKEHVFVGYCENTKGYRCIDPVNPKKICIARNVEFIENFNRNAQKKQASEQYIQVQDGILITTTTTRTEVSKCDVNSSRVQVMESESHASTSVKESCPVNVELSISDDASIVSHFSDNEVNNVVMDKSENVNQFSNVTEFSRNQNFEENQQRYPSRCRKPRDFEDYVLYQAVCHEDCEPITISEVMKRSDKQKWMSAMEEELNSLKENEVYTFVDRPAEKKIVKNKWVFKIKRNSDGSISRYKARLVAKGFTQVYGEDYDETFSPVVRNSTIRFLMALSIELDLSIDHLDVMTAFLNGELEEDVYMEQPEGFIVAGQEHKVCKLNKALYGLKQASRQWNKKLNSMFIENGYNRSEYEPCMYFKIAGESVIIIAVWVDDCIIFSNDDYEKKRLKEIMANYFKIKDLGEAKFCLGVRINQNRSRGEIYIDQKKYIEEILGKFGMTNCNPVRTPIDKNVKLKKSTEGNEEGIKDLPYQCLIGSLMFLAVTTRPDIAYVTSMLSKFNNCYTQEHFNAAKRVLRYLKGTMDKCLVYRKTNDKIVGYVDADYANDEDDRRSYTGYVFMYGGAAISWESKKQRTVALSSTEAEYMGLSEACKEAIYLRNVYEELMSRPMTITLYNDNQAAQKIAHNPVYHKRTKHIDTRFHFIREVVERDVVQVKYVSTNDMIADVLTKGLDARKQMSCEEGMGLRSPD